MNQEEWDKIKEKIRQNKHFGDKHPTLRKVRKSILWFSLVLVPLMPLVLTENFVTACSICQWLIRVMSSWIPGIEVMSHASNIPHIVSLELSLAWISILLLFIMLLILFSIDDESYFMFFPNSKWFLIFIYLGATLFLMIELGLIGHQSFYHGTIGLFSPSSRHNLFNILIQSKIGLIIFVEIEIVYIISLLIGWIALNLQILRNLIYKAQS